MVQGSQKKKKNLWTVFNNSQDFCSQVYWYLLHVDSTCAGVHVPCSLRVAGLLPTSSTTCVTSFCGCWALLLHWVVWSHLHTDRSPISSAFPSCTSLPSPSPGVTAPGKKKAIWSHPVLPFPPGRPESLIWAFFYCLLRACSSFKKPRCFAPGRPLLVLFFLLNLALYAEKCWDRAARMVRDATLLLMVCNLTTNCLYLELAFSRCYKIKAVPRDRC